MKSSIRCASVAGRCWRAGLAMCIAAASLAGAASAQTVAAVPTSITKPVMSSVSAPVSGTATVGGETITITGTIQVDATAVPDLTFRAPPMVVLSIRFLDLAGVGQTTRATFRSRSVIQKTRPLAASDLIDVTFPVVPTDVEGYGKARIARASLALSFDTAQGLLTGAAGTVSTSRY